MWSLETALKFIIPDTLYQKGKNNTITFVFDLSFTYLPYDVI